jgi:hypothetical protein
MSMVPVSRETTDQALIDEFLAKGGTITKGKTKSMPRELGISNMTWNNPMTKSEKNDSKAKDEK